MNRIWLSLLIGTVAEGLIWGLGSVFARFGPCGPGNTAAGILLLVHLPGFRVARLLHAQGSALDFPITIIVTTMMWSLATYLVGSAVAKSEKAR